MPFLTGYFARRRGLDARLWLVAAAPFVAVAVVVNLYPYGEGSAATATPPTAAITANVTTNVFKRPAMLLLQR